MFYLKHIFRLRETLQIAQEEEEKPFLDHLEDLRKVIFRMLITLFIVMLLCFNFAPQMMEILRHPVDQIWQRYESEHLPDGVSAESWQKAKELSGITGGLSPQAVSVLAEKCDSGAFRLLPLVPILKAAAILPEKERADFISQATPPELRGLALSLWEKGAVLQSGSGRESLRMMGSFQPGESFLLSIKMAFFGGCVVAFPLLMFFLLQFIVPGLLKNERVLLYKSLAFGFFLFLAGCSFAYFGVLPRVLTFFFEYSLDLGIENDWRIGYYLSFAIKLIFMFGITFELPVLIIPLVKLRIISYELMRSTRTYAIAAILILALLIAPTPDPGTMLVMALPMYLLYEICIGYAWYDQRNRLKQEEL